ncbi:MAG TPA: DUF3144 domain-containing protein [Motiliproteus sp.]
MSDPVDPKAVYAIADKFIALANELAASDDSGNVGMGIRYAAARYNSFEASLMTPDLAADKDKMLAMFTDDFNKMMLENLEDYIRHLASLQGQH